MRPAVRNRLIIGAVAVAAGAVIAYEMFFSLTPPRHADHDHAMATLDAGGFLWVQEADGGRRNLVGRPGKVLVLHWFDPTAFSPEQSRAARWAAEVADDPSVEVLFVAQAPSWRSLDGWAQAVEVPEESLYLDEEGRTGELIGIRRLPETLVYDPAGLLAYQAKGAASWAPGGVPAQVERAKGGVEEIH